MDNQEIDVLRELAHERATEKQVAALSQPDYFPEKTPIQKLQEEEFSLKKRLLQI